MTLTLHSFPFQAMGGPCELRLYAATPARAERAAEAAIGEVLRIEQQYSRYRDDSIVSEINRAAGRKTVSVDAETAALLDYAATAFVESEGLFDISSGVLRRAWDFRSGKLPRQETLTTLLELVGWDKVIWENPEIHLSLPGMEIDFGGFGKEYAADAAARICREQGIAHGLVELGGDIHVIGPHPDGKAWQIGIRHPRDPVKPITVISMLQGGLASSGDYERFMLVDGQRYSHILNPRSAWPVANSFAGVSVAAPLCLLAGTAATVAMLKGQDTAPRWLDGLGLAHCWVSQEMTLGGNLGRR